MNAEHCKAYTLLQEQQIDDIHAHGYLLRHNKSGARVLLLENEDDNKVFNIAFRTPPADSTGVAHILEHSVLSQIPVKGSLRRTRQRIPEHLLKCYDLPG